MSSSNNAIFFPGTVRYLVILFGIIEVLSVIIFILTELGNVASNFWLTNVFAGSWCGLIVLIHAVTLFAIGCCLRGPTAAFRSVIVTIITLLACALLISFNSVFIALPSTCILTSSCTNNSNSATLFSYTMNYGLSQTKFLFQTIQLALGCLCFVLYVMYLVVYFIAKRQLAKERILARKSRPPVPLVSQIANERTTSYKSLRSANTVETI